MDDQDTDLVIPANTISPPQGPWKLPALYQIAVNGSIYVWEIGFDGRDRLVISRGIHEGQLHQSSHFVEIKRGKESISDQALSDARGRYNKKHRKGYRTGDIQLPSNSKPMLADSYEKYRKLVNFPAAIQPKLDGFRMLASLTEHGIHCRSRQNYVFKSLRHVQEDLLTLFPYLPENVELDGELIIEGCAISTIASIVKTEKKLHPRIREVRYYIFDAKQQGVPFENRIDSVLDAAEACIGDGNEISSITVLGYDIVNSHEEAMKAMYDYIDSGYEGAVLKRLGSSARNDKEYAKSLYREGKRDHILKLKSFIEADATIIDVYPGKGTEEGAAVFRVEDHEYGIFGVRMRGSLEQRREWYRHKEKYIGRIITYRCCPERTPYGIPFQPVGIKIRDEELD